VRHYYKGRTKKKEKISVCGITGFLDLRTSEGAADMEARVTAMADTLEHRGPDSWAAWVDADAGIAFGHRRLAIVDLSETGAQPMTSSCGRFVICYNGMIYNAPKIRDELAAKGRTFRGSSDTEVMIEAFSQWGVEDSLDRLVGMFAFALWDRRKRELILARDRLGIKPLYWGRMGSAFLFGSEIKALKAHPAWQGRINRGALAAYMRYAYVPAPFAIFEGVQKLLPGTLLRLKSGAAEPEIKTFWDLKTVIGQARSRPAVDENSAIEEFHGVLKKAVSERMLSDVPVGALLSGGIDSSIVTALMQAGSSRPIRTFTVGFGEASHDESGYARAVAEHLGTDHTELHVDPAKALEVLAQVPKHYDEPFADSSQIPTMLVSELVRRHVTVVLSGDGGDEVFAGYNRHVVGPKAWAATRRFPGFLRQIAAAGLHGVPPATWDRAASLLPEASRPRQFGDKLHKLAATLGARSEDDFYRSLISLWPTATTPVPGAAEIVPPALDHGLDGLTLPFMERMQALDTLTYLPDDILTKVDRASMAVGLEARVPLIDHRVVEYAWTLPSRLKVRDGTGKWILRRILEEYVPKPLFERPKSGFAVSLDDWLRGPLRTWAEDLLTERRLKDVGELNPAPIRRMWQEHLSGARNWQHPLWCVLMYQAWLEA
jgi:asparagine synthase (glutamine-hydrolysing)